MDTLIEILTVHAGRYPLMQPADAVKLLYQNEFGGGHLIRDENACLAYLRREYAAVEKNPAAPLLEDIGNGFVRVMLATLAENALEQLGEDFIRSAAYKGSLESFRQKLAVLTELTQAGVFSFGEAALTEYLREYEKAGYPAVSHSGIYRAAYHPAYRVVRRDFLHI